MWRGNAYCFIIGLMEHINCISPIDGRYRSLAKALSGYFSERALIKYRVLAEVEYLLALSKLALPRFKKLSEKEKKSLLKLRDVSESDALLVKKIETEGAKTIPATRHDVKAVEYFIKDRLRACGLAALSEWTHFALTSEDTNSMAYGLMLSDALSEEIIPALEQLRCALRELAQKHADAPLLARTHGQPAVATTFGKEFKIFEARLDRQLSQLKNTAVLVKLGGAVGNYNAHCAALPKVNWRKFSADFARRFNSGRAIKLAVNPVTAQTEPHDNQAEIFDNMRRINTLLTDFCQDIWRYISDGLIMQRPVRGEIGSSTMPQKINPIDFENAEGNFGLANALFAHFSAKLPISRLQRDLSDSTVQRNIGCAFAYSLIACRSVLRGLSKIEVNRPLALEMLRQHPEIVSEAIQTVMRLEGEENAYEKLKELTRGKKLSSARLNAFVDTLKISRASKKALKKLKPENYTGLAREIAAK